MPLIEPVNRLLAEVLPNNRFYAAKLAGLPHRYASVAEFRARVPFTTKPELVADQQAHPPFGSNLTFPVDRYTRFSQTSGTTGQPMRWLDTPESWEWMIGNWKRVFHAGGVGPGDRIFFAFSFGPFLGFWVGFEAAARMGCLCIPAGSMPSGARLRVMADAAATVLCCTPTYAIHLGQSAAGLGFDLSRSSVRRIVVAGEPGGSIAGTRARIEQLWPGAQVVDHHGMTEIGPVSYACPKRAGVLHVIESSYLAEVIHPETLAPLERGDTGELVLTNLGRFGSPLLRYRTGDLVVTEPAPQCACETTDLALAGGIASRTDDMVVVRGVNVYPGAIEDILRQAGGVAEYRVEIRSQQALVEMSLQVEPENPGDHGLAQRLETVLRDALALRIPVTIVECGSLPRFEMKARRWVRL